LERFSRLDRFIIKSKVARLIWEKPMLRWAIIFFVIAVIAAVLGFGGIAGAASGIAQLLFFVFIVLFVIGLIMHLVRKA